MTVRLWKIDQLQAVYHSLKHKPQSLRSLTFSVPSTGAVGRQLAIWIDTLKLDALLASMQLERVRIQLEIHGRPAGIVAAARHTEMAQQARIVANSLPGFRASGQGTLEVTYCLGKEGLGIGYHTGTDSGQSASPLTCLRIHTSR